MIDCDIVISEIQMMMCKQHSYVLRINSKMFGVYLQITPMYCNTLFVDIIGQLSCFFVMNLEFMSSTFSCLVTGM